MAETQTFTLKDPPDDDERDLLESIGIKFSNKTTFKAVVVDQGRLESAPPDHYVEVRSPNDEHSGTYTFWGPRFKDETELSTVTPERDLLDKPES